MGPRTLFLLSLVLLIGCPQPRGDDDDEPEFEGDDPGECGDGADNDRDGFFDCDDQDCFGAPECGGGDDDDDTGDDDDATGDDDDATGDDDDATGDDDDSTAGPTAFMYAHTSSTLFAVDPSTYALTTIGAFSGQAPLFGVTDLAIDLQGTMWAISFEGSYEVDPNTAVMTQRGSWFPAEYNSLTFLTDGRLLAGEGSTLYEIDLTTGAPTSMGTVPGGLVFAGDMVGLPDGLLYCLMAPTANSAQTSLVIYNPSTGQVEDTFSTGQGTMFGVGYAQGTIYGFTEGGIIYSINPANGAATNVASAGQPFWGAATNPTRWSE